MITTSRSELFEITVRVAEICHASEEVIARGGPPRALFSRPRILGPAREGISPNAQSRCGNRSDEFRPRILVKFRRKSQASPLLAAMTTA
jgi:hypothetical protein